MDSIFPSKVEYKQIDTFIALCDGLIYDTTVDEIKDVIAPDFPQEKLQEYVKTFTRPSQTPGFREAIYDTINSNTTNASRSFGILCNILGSRILAPTLTNSLTPIKDMTLKERETLLASWRDSPLAAKRRLFRAICALSGTTIVRLASELHLKAIHFPQRDLRETAYEGPSHRTIQVRFYGETKL